jgi:radical SAM protein with 4Fe4S-binding SPASM domain
MTTGKDQFHIQWHITHLCNLRCKHCYQDDFSNQRDLDWEGLQQVSNNILTTLKGWDKTTCIHLTGGEPLLKPELFPLLNDLNQNSKVEELGIITNGLLDQEAIRKLSGYSKLKKMKISLDGADAKINDSIRPKGTFERVMRNLSLIKKEERFEIIIMFTLLKRNFKSLLSLFKLCQDLGVDGLIIERFIPLGRGKEIMGDVLNKEEWKEMIGILLNFIPTEGGNQSFLPYQAFQIRFDGKEPELLGAPCVIGRDGMCVMPNGDIFPCRRFPVSIGNLLSDSLKTIWEKSELLEKLRRKENLKGKCGRCEIKECRGCRSLALSLTGDYLGEDPHCWYDFGYKDL